VDGKGVHVTHNGLSSPMVALFAREEAGAKIVGAATPGRLVSHTGFKLGHGSLWRCRLPPTLVGLGHV
jgi:hypothetical protein